MATIDFLGRLCGTGTDVEIDVAVVYTPAARDAAGGVAAIEAEIDLMVAETNQAYEASGVNHRVVLAGRSEVPYSETGDSDLDLDRLRDPSDGHLDGVHTLRERVGADLVHLIVGEADDICGLAFVPGVFGLTLQGCGGRTFAHELGHSMGLRHDRHAQLYSSSEVGRGPVTRDPAFGYVNQRTFEPGALPLSRWRTIMAYNAQCDDAGFYCSRVLAFSSPRLHIDGDPLGVAYGAGGTGVTGPADAVAVLNATGPAVALWRDRIPGRANRPPTVVGSLPDQNLTLGSALDVDVSVAFVDPDGDTLTYRVSSTPPNVVTAALAGRSTVTLTAVGLGTATIQVTATDPGGLSAMLSFAVTVSSSGNLPPEPVGTLPPVTMQADGAAVTVDVAGAFRDPDGDRLTYGASSSRLAVAAVSVSGSRVMVRPRAPGSTMITVTATDAGGSNRTATQSFGVTVLEPFTDDPIVPGETPVRAIHFTELRARIDGLRAAAGLVAVRLDGPGPAGGGYAGQARALDGAAVGVGRGVRGGGAAGPAVDRYRGGRGDDPYPGGACDGAARRRGGVGVRLRGRDRAPRMGDRRGCLRRSVVRIGRGGAIAEESGRCPLKGYGRHGPAHAGVRRRGHRRAHPRKS